MKPRIFLPLILCLVTAVEQLPAQGSAPPSAAELARSLDAYFARASSFGFSGTVLIAEKGEILLHQGYGLADREAGIPLTKTMPLHIGSLGKQFTAAAILRLQAEGRLSTSDHLDRFFPEVPEGKQAITLHHLLSHTSGLPYLTTRSFMEDRPRAEIMREMLDLPLQFEPGSRYAYSNPAYTLLAGVIERVSGEAYEQYLERAIFRPAGLENTGFVNDAARWTGVRLRAYTGENDEGEPLSAMRPLPKAVGAGSIVSTVQDLYRWDRVLQRDDVLPASARMQLFAPAVQIREEQHYGYGWMITRTPRGETLVHHAGDLGGYNADLRRYVERDLVIIVTSNARADGGGYRTLATNALAYLLNGQELRIPPAVNSTGNAKTLALAGEYEVAPGNRLHVRARGQGLSIGGTGESVLLALGGASDSAATARSRLLSERAALVASGIAAQETGPLREHLHASRSFDGTSRWLVNSTASLEDRLGAFRGIESLGTAVLSPTTARSYFHLLFEHGSYPVVYTWTGEKISGFDSEYIVPMETPFLPTGASSFVSHDLFTGRTIEARFEPGVALRLTIAGAGTPLTGIRVTDPHVP
jgi:CubicO group peptidase (beta-lactamase class C family)